MVRQQPLPGRAGYLVSATEIVRTKYNARAWQWFSTFSLKAFVNRVNHLMLVPNGEVCVSANKVLNKVRVRIALSYLLNRADALGLSIARSEPSYRNYFSTIVGYSGLHGNPT